MSPLSLLSSRLYKLSSYIFPDKFCARSVPISISTTFHMLFWLTNLPNWLRTCFWFFWCRYVTGDVTSVCGLVGISSCRRDICACAIHMLWRWRWSYYILILTCFFIYKEGGLVTFLDPLRKPVLHQLYHPINFTAWLIGIVFRKLDRAFCYTISLFDFIVS